jgi:DNA-directed RNA polymerase subunit M/transcription elongation factor TFIIS
MKRLQKRQKKNKVGEVMPFLIPDSSQLHLTFRFKAFFMLQSVCGDNIKYARNLESALYTAAHNDGMVYENGVRRVFFALLKNNLWINRFNAATLASLDEYTLAEGTPVEGWLDKLKCRSQRQEQIMADSIQTNEEEGPSSLKCGRCKSTNISIEQKQTRGADEAMTVFVTCEKCNLRWKM